MKLGKLIYILVIILLVMIFVVSAVYVGRYFYLADRQQSEYDDLAALVESARQDESEAPQDGEQDAGLSSEDSPSGQPQPVILREYQTLYDMNNHMVGWIRIEDTDINYPVMQTPDEKDYYLHRNFNRQYSDRGCIYAREECDIFAPSDNITIYGHHMVDGSMFQDLSRYQKKEFWEDHDTIIFDTLYEHHTYRIFAVFKTTASIGEGFPYHQFVDAADQAAFDDFVATCTRLAFYDTGIIPEYGDKLICLSTCEYSLTNGRLVVAAVRIS